MKKSNKQVNQKQKQSILNASRKLLNIMYAFDGDNTTTIKKFPKKTGFFGKVKEEECFYKVNGFLVSTGSKADALKVISPEFLQEVSSFLENEPNNIHAQNITKTLIKGANF